MRIAISGTHHMGKTTMIEDFLAIHPEYHSEIEPYYALQEEQGFIFPEEPTVDCMLIQLDYSLTRLEALSNQKNFILDRCPVDFIAYSFAILEHEQEASVALIKTRSGSLTETPFYHACNEGFSMLR